MDTVGCVEVRGSHGAEKRQSVGMKQTLWEIVAVLHRRFKGHLRGDRKTHPPAADPNAHSKKTDLIRNQELRMPERIAKPVPDVR